MRRHTYIHTYIYNITNNDDDDDDDDDSNNDGDDDDNNKKKKKKKKKKKNNNDDDDDDGYDDGDNNNNNKNNNNNNRIERRKSRFFTISSLLREPSPIRTLKWPGHNRVQITCVCQVQHVVLRAKSYEGTAHLLSLTEFKSHLFELHLIG